jgi:MFS family permease
VTDKPASPLRHRDFGWFWLGQSASIAGNGIFRVALPLEVLRLTGNPFDLALVLAVDQIPTVLFLLVGGALVDRLSRRLIMLVSDIVGGLAMLTMSVLIGTGDVRLWHLMVLALITGIATALYLPASSAIVPDLLPAELLTGGNSLMSLSQSLGEFLLGPLVGGVIVALAGTSWAFGIDGATFLISAGCLALVSRIPRNQPDEKSTMREEIKAGLRYSVSRRWLWWNMIAMGVANLAAYLPLFVVMPLLVKDELKAGSFGLGLVYAASGVGGALTSLWARRRDAPRRPIAAMWIAMTTGSAAVCLLGGSPTLWLAVLFSAVMWGGVTYANIVWFSALQERVPGELLGRVMSLDLLFGIALGPVGFFLGGIGSDSIGPRATLVVGGLVAVATGVVAFVPRVLDPGDQPVASQAPADALPG